MHIRTTTNMWLAESEPGVVIWSNPQLLGPAPLAEGNNFRGFLDAPGHQQRIARLLDGLSHRPHVHLRGFSRATPDTGCSARQVRGQHPLKQARKGAWTARQHNWGGYPYPTYTSGPSIVSPLSIYCGIEVRRSC